MQLKFISFIEAELIWNSIVLSLIEDPRNPFNLTSDFGEISTYMKETSKKNCDKSSIVLTSGVCLTRNHFIFSKNNLYETIVGHASILWELSIRMYNRQSVQQQQQLKEMTRQSYSFMLSTSQPELSPQIQLKNGIYFIGYAGENRYLHSNYEIPKPIFQHMTDLLNSLV